MKVFPLETGIIYGPIFSRRLGRSLGVNLLPTGYKTCSFDCRYCHYGYTTLKTLHPPREDFPTSTAALAAIQQALQRERTLNYLTFSGNGEPTLHPDFPAIAAQVKQLRDELAPHVKLALFSNATTLHRPEILESLSLFDAPLLKLDAGNPQTLARIDAPTPEVTFAQLVAGLKQVPRLTIQSMLISGELSNTDAASLNAWIATLAEIKPAQVQLYSTDYPVPDERLQRVLPYELERIAKQVEARTGIPTTAYYPI
ncbi:MAG: radical SAM protein [Chloroflexota bacterium]|nr:radical SAM protein [Chloroflexota bacterium]